MFKLYHDPGFTFRFAENRLLSSFQAEGSAEGQWAQVFLLGSDQETPERLIVEGPLSAGGKLELPAALLVRPGEIYRLFLTATQETPL